MSNDCPGNDLPVVRVVRGAPTTEELAAVVGVVLARARRPVPAPTSRWAASGRPGGLRTDLGTHAWRTAALPR